MAYISNLPFIGRVENKTQGALQAQIICVCLHLWVYRRTTYTMCFKKGNLDEERLLKQGKFQQNVTFALETRKLE